jgi:hypothetical protein
MAATTNKKGKAASRALVSCRISGAAAVKNATVKNAVAQKITAKTIKAKKRMKFIASNSNILDAEW